MSQDPREAFNRVQRQLQQRFRGGGGGMPGPASIGGAVGIAALVFGGVALSQSLFNGISHFKYGNITY